MAIEIGYPDWIKDNAKLDAEYEGVSSKHFADVQGSRALVQSL